MEEEQKQSESGEKEPNQNESQSKVEEAKQRAEKTKQLVNKGRRIASILSTIGSILSSPVTWIAGGILFLSLALTSFLMIVGPQTFSDDCTFNANGSSSTVTKEIKEKCEKQGAGKRIRTTGSLNKKKKGKNGSIGNFKGQGKKGVKDGEGSTDYASDTLWTPDQLPEELRKYAINPEELGMQYGADGGWFIFTAPGWIGQCTELSASLMNKLWEKDGVGPEQLLGAGIDVAHNWAAKFGGSVSLQPSSGAVFSSNGISKDGHTGVVSHVFEDGSILIVEQNVPGYSGHSNHTPMTWNYRLVRPETQQAHGYVFYDPSQAGFSIKI